MLSQRARKSSTQKRVVRAKLQRWWLEFFRRKGFEQWGCHEVGRSRAFHKVCGRTQSEGHDPRRLMHEGKMRE